MPGLDLRASTREAGECVEDLLSLQRISRQYPLVDIDTQL